MLMCLCAREHMDHMYVGDCVELALLVVWVPGTNPGFSGRAAIVLTAKPFLQPQDFRFADDEFWLPAIGAFW